MKLFRDIKLGKLPVLGGIDFYVNTSLIAFIIGVAVSSAIHEGVLKALASIFTLICVYAIVTLHELGHSTAAATQIRLHST